MNNEQSWQETLGLFIVFVGAFFCFGSGFDGIGMLIGFSLLILGFSIAIFGLFYQRRKWRKELLIIVPEWEWKDKEEKLKELLAKERNHTYF